MHDTGQLMKCGLADEEISPLFLGVFPADEIPMFFPHKDWCLIANTDPASKKGKHWISLGYHWNTFFFFDSYGKQPSTYRADWARFNKWFQHGRDLQQMISDVCGDWCLYWNLCLARSPSKQRLEKWMNMFSEDTKESNDLHVFDKIHSRFPRILNSTKHFITLESIVKKRLDALKCPHYLSCNQVCTKRQC